ncbi:hypothetical protein H1P_1460005 [Hyella patelloides LEGE 07179]|uniref:Uncharacterized protein n=1 Tax=Hyella patelloides LEGE 07179 TaxID=945734 RepID=A0A563VLP8_9CYAN|nr:hypothetical protein H1P_1460005 [Hyella patelloides LEGE 07179]
MNNTTLNWKAYDIFKYAMISHEKEARSTNKVRKKKVNSC